MSITLSKEHGVNPSINHCFICGNEIGLILFGRLKGDVEAPRNCCSGELCDDCKDKLKTHVAVLEVKSESNPERTGRAIFIPKESVAIENKGIVYMPSEDFNKTFNIKNNERN